MTARPGYGRGRKPVNLQPQQPRMVLWDCIRSLKTFTTQELISAANRHSDHRIRSGTALRFLNRLGTAGLVELVQQEKRTGCAVVNHYKLVKDVGPELPRMKTDGSLINGGANENLWRTMWILNTFTARELIVAAVTEEVSISLKTALNYCRALVKAGYLIQNDAKTKTYRTVPNRNTGPQPPAIQRVNAVYDPNLRKVVWPAEMAEGGGL